jgi:nudix-type nucleoside diphosphatase (YffH/AdpP family)
LPPLRRVDIRKTTRVFDDHFNVDELVLAYEHSDGTMSAEQRRLVLQNKDSSSVFLFNADTKKVILVNHFKAPTLGGTSGWITETIAGRIQAYESPEIAALRAVTAKTGYRIRKLESITTYFPAPSYSSERIHLYYAEVNNADKQENNQGNGPNHSNRGLMHLEFGDLIEKLKQGHIEDPKIIISAFWLSEKLKSLGRSVLDHRSVKFELIETPGCFIGYHTGPISGIKNVNLWVNSENEDMIMDRYIGRSISANIRYLGADRDGDGNLTEDIISNRLDGLVRKQSPVRIGTVIETEAGLLNKTHGVHAILHVSTVRGAGAGKGVKADIDDLFRCTMNVLIKANERNKKLQFLRRFNWICEWFNLQISRSILIPIIGGGDGGLSVEHILPKLFDAAVTYFKETPETTLKEVYFLAFTQDQERACQKQIETLQTANKLQLTAAT